MKKTVKNNFTEHTCKIERRKTMSVHDELINTIMSMTPEQFDRFVNHPMVKQIMAERAEGKENVQ